MKRLLLAVLLITGGAVQAADLTSCSATYTVASAAFANVNENRNADGSAYLAGQTRLLATSRQYGGNEQLSSSMYRQSLAVQQSRFKSGGWPALSKDLAECQRVVDSYIK